MEVLLKVRDLRVEFCRGRGQGHTALDGISFEVCRGEIVGLMGESGSGKSTTALALLGLLPAESVRATGSVTFRGRELFSLSEREWQEVRGSEISLVFQEPEIALCPVMRAGEQVAEVIRAHRKWDWPRCRQEARNGLARVGLAEQRFFSAYPNQLSGGQRQRVVLAQALACEPTLLIADEPTASLDARSQAEFLALLQSLRAQTGLAVLLISHSPEVQASTADRLIVLKDGQILEQGAFDHLHSTPAHPYTRKLLGATRGAINPPVPRHAREVAPVS
jgi:ABC-type glutathione transport system ATPase component